MAKIIGNLQTANKFYVINSAGNIEWVPNINIAKQYQTNPNNQEWFNKDIYATNEEFYIHTDGKTYLKSQIPTIDTTISMTIQLEEFKNQADEYVNMKLQDFANSSRYESIHTMISWVDSEDENFAKEAKKAIKYRDLLYKHKHDFINNLEERLEKNEEEDILLKMHDSFIKTFPKRPGEPNE